MASMFDLAKDVTAEGNRIAETAVKKAMADLKASPDDPVLLADLQHQMNKYAHNFSLSATILRLYKDLFQSMLQKF